jgi:hypothetical protein
LPRSKSRVQIPSPAPEFVNPRPGRGFFPWRGSQVVRPRSAKPLSPVRFRPAPPVSPKRGCGTRSFAGLRISAAGSRSPFGACSRLLNASSSIPARASSFPKTWVWDEVLRWAQDFGSRLPLALWGLLTPAKRLKFDSGPRLQLPPKSGWDEVLRCAQDFGSRLPACPLGCAGTKNPRPGDYQAGAGFF